MNTKLLIPLCAAVALLAGCKDRSHDATKADEPAATPSTTTTPAETPPPPADAAPADTAPSNPPPADTQPANPPPSGGG